MQQELPQLKIIPLDKIGLHEDPDSFRVSKIQRSLKKKRIYTNPVIVAEVSKSRYVLLDGANRYTACQKLGLRDILAQIVDYKDPRMGLSAWHHVVVGIKKSNFLAAVAELDLPLEKVSYAQAGKLLAKQKALCFFEFADGTRYAIKNNDTIPEKVAVINKIIGLYKSKFTYYRVMEDQLSKAKKHYRSASMLVAFPTFTPQGIKQMARSGVILASGITRHDFPQRALRVNIPVSILRRRDTLVAKNRWLKQFIQQKIDRKQVRLYLEPICLYDEY